MPDVESRTSAKPVDEVLAEFNQRKDHFEDLRGTTRQLIETILKQEVITVQSVQARVKKKEKIKSKYCDPERDYKCLDDISDIVGFRIITYYSDKIDQIAQIIEQEFAECGTREDKRKGKLDSFGYSAIHFDCAYSPVRSKYAEYKRFAKDRFEIQVTTVLGHAWAEMQHPWYDESKPPSEEMRRFYRLAAVLELAEQEFLQVRNQKEERERVASVRVEAKAPAIPITPESLAAFIAQKTLVNELDDKCVKIQNAKAPVDPIPKMLSSLAILLTGVGIDTIERLEDELRRAGEAAVEFLARRWPMMPPENQVAVPQYVRGFCLAHLANFLTFLQGRERQQLVRAKVGIKQLGDDDFDRQSAAAQEVAKEYGIA